MSDETIKALKAPESGLVFVYVGIPGAMITLSTVTPERLRDVADEVERMRGIPVMSDAAKVRKALDLLEAYDSHADDCWCDLCRAIGILEGSYILQEAV